MAQLVSYNFSIIEDPLSDHGNFTTLSDGLFTNPLETISGNLCQVDVNSFGATGGSFWSGRSWAPDQYSELTVVSGPANTNYSPALMVRIADATSGTYYLTFLANANTGPGTSAISTSSFIGGVSNPLNNIMGLTIVSGDVFRLSVTGTTLTITQNGVVVDTIIDNSISSGSPGFGLSIANSQTDSQTNLWAAGTPGGSGGGLGTGTLMGNVIIDVDGQGFPIAESQVGTDA
jgi:hypothetical protein